MPVIPVIAAVGSAAVAAAPANSAGASIYGAIKGMKGGASGGGGGAVSGGAPQMDTVAANKAVTDTSFANAKSSEELDALYNPTGRAFREQSLQKMLDENKAGNPYGDWGQFAPQNIGPYTPYSRKISDMTTAAEQAAFERFRRGGKLDVDTANAIARASAAKGGNNLLLGRELAQRDLGRSSEDTALQRTATLGAYGAAADARAQADRQAYDDYQRYQQSFLANQFGGNRQDYNLFNQNRQNFGQQNFINALAAGQFGQTIQKPQTGMAPGDVAKYMAGNVGLQADYNQQQAAIAANRNNSITELGGKGLGVLGSLGKLGNIFGKPKTPAAGGGGNVGPDDTFPYV